jgi:TonB family protein
MHRRMLLLLLSGLVGFAAAAHAQGDTVYEMGQGIKAPVLVKTVKAVYAKEAMEQRIEGTVLIAAVVQADGKVGDVTVAKSLDAVYGLDKEAVKAVKQYEFKPGTKDDKPVAVRVQIEVTFTLK